MYDNGFYKMTKVNKFKLYIAIIFVALSPVTICAAILVLIKLHSLGAF